MPKWLTAWGKPPAPRQYSRFSGKNPSGVFPTPITATLFFSSAKLGMAQALASERSITSYRISCKINNDGVHPTMRLSLERGQARKRCHELIGRKGTHLFGREHRYILIDR